jgi:fission process protein 1
VAVAVKGASRYLAYTSDVGEAFRPVVPVRIVRAAYAISWAYVGTDVAIEGYKEYQNGGTQTEVLRTVISRGIFQSMASMILPAITIHSTVHLSDGVFKRVGKFQKWGPTVAGISFIRYILNISRIGGDTFSSLHV